MRPDAAVILPTSADPQVPSRQGEPPGDAPSAGQAVAVERPGSWPAGGDSSHPGLCEGFRPSMAGDDPEERPQPLPEPGVPGDAAVAPEDTETAVAVRSADLAPPPPRPTFLVEAARCLAAQATAAGPAPAATSEAAADRARLPEAVPQLTTQVVISQEDRASQSAEAKAPKEIRFDPAGAAPGDGQRPVAGCEARARGPTGN
jgi:hypothetical protein